MRKATPQLAADVLFQFSELAGVALSILRVLVQAAHQCKVISIVAEIIHTYGLVNVCESVTFVDYSTLVMRHYRE